MTISERWFEEDDLVEAICIKAFKSPGGWFSINPLQIYNVLVIKDKHAYLVRKSGQIYWYFYNRKNIRIDGNAMTPIFEEHFRLL
jgi:hypothetical protein